MGVPLMAPGRGAEGGAGVAEGARTTVEVYGRWRHFGSIQFVRNNRKPRPHASPTTREATRSETSVLFRDTPLSCCLTWGFWDVAPVDHG